MKRIVSLLLCLAFVFLCACNSEVASDKITAAQKANNEPVLTEQDAERLMSLMSKLESYRGGGAVQKQIKIELEKVEWVEKVVETDDGGLTCFTDFGVTAVWTPEQKNDRLADLKKLRLETNLMSYDGVAVKQIAILCPYASSEPHFNIDGYTTLGKDLSDNISCNVTVLKDEEVNLETLKNLDKYDMVWFYSFGALSSLLDSTMALVGNEPYIMTGEKIKSIEDCIKYSSDFLNGRIVMNLRDGRIGVGGKFFERYYDVNDLVGMFFHLASSFSMSTQSLADGILSRGAAWVEGWSGPVNYDNDYMQFANVVSGLLAGKSAQQAVKDADRAVKSGYSFYQTDCTLVGKGDTVYDIKKVYDTGAQSVEKVTSAVTTQIVTEAVTEITQAVTEAATQSVTQPNTTAPQTTAKRPEPVTQQKETTTRRKPTTTRTPTTKVPATKAPDSNSSVVVGKYITLGSYEQDNNRSNGKERIEWLVLAKQGDKALVISRYALDCKTFNSTKTNVTWETSSMRSWLNNDFMNAAFTSSEKSRIATTTVAADANPSYTTSPGNSTRDKVFLLSAKEANRYFASDKARLCTPTDYAIAQGAWTSTIEGNEEACWWWLRTPGYRQTEATSVGTAGTVNDFGDSVDRVRDAVRPAMWITL